jgi:heme-degrading monooxygenase HmoA
MEPCRTVAGMSKIIHLPEPPYYAVIAPATLGPDVSGYAEMAERAIASASGLAGFHGLETCVQPGFSMAVSYWSSLEAIDAWRNDPQHRQAKAAGMSRWFTGYATRIAQVIDQY